MDTLKAQLVSEFSSFTKHPITSITEITGSGSDRYYIRIHFNNDSLIAVYNENITENETFIYYTTCLQSLGLSVPNILHISDSKKILFQSDIGSASLLDFIQHSPQSTSSMYKKVIDEMFKFQFTEPGQIDFSYSLVKKRFDSDQVNWDLNYCKYYFFKVGLKQLDENRLQQDFNTLAAVILSAPATGFLYRDFQARNIFITENRPFFIDYQGGMEGPFYYDLASLIYHSRAKLSDRIKQELIDYYYTQLQNYRKIDKQCFNETLDAFVLLRYLQNLGAYGFRGMIEKKALFLKTIPTALEESCKTMNKLKQSGRFGYLTDILLTLKNNTALWSKNN